MKTRSEPIKLTRRAVSVKLLQYRKKESLTQQKLADRLGVKRATLASWEERRATPPAWLLDKICDLLGVGFKELIK